MTDAYVGGAEILRCRVDDGQRYALRCRCGRVHLLGFDTDPAQPGQVVLVVVEPDRRRGPGSRIWARWRRFWRGL